MVAIMVDRVARTPTVALVVLVLVQECFRHPAWAVAVPTVPQDDTLVRPKDRRVRKVRRVLGKPAPAAWSIA
jgi:hypothetical protein